MAKKVTKNSKTTKNNNEMVLRLIYTLITLMLSVIGAFRLGIIGIFINNIFRVLVGQYPFLFLGLISVFSVVYLFKPNFYKDEEKRVWISLSLLLIVFLSALSFPVDKELVGLNVIGKFNSQVIDIWKDPKVFAFGGYIGSVIYGLSSLLFERTGTIIFNAVIMIISMILLFTPSKILNTLKLIGVNIKKVFSFMFSMLTPSKIKKEKVQDEEVELETEDETIFVPEPVDHSQNKVLDIEDDASVVEQKKSIFMDVDLKKPKSNIPSDSGSQLQFNLDPVKKGDKDFEKSDVSRSFENYQLPPISLLDGAKKSNKSSLNSNSAKDKGKRLIEVLSRFGIDAELLDIHIGPSVTKFEIKPDSNVKISKITSVQDNIMMELAVTSLRIEAPIPGRAAVGIEIPNVEMLPVRLREIITKSKNFYDKENVWVALGKNLLGEPITIALNKMPHLLIAGATGSGKSVCINSLISSILISKHPEELKLLLIDPKKVEFAPYTKIPHLMSEVVTDPMLASAALKKIVVEMEERYQTFASAGVRNIIGYNEKIKENPEANEKLMPWIVVIIDELADLMAVAGKDVEMSIQRITQLARAAGIHLVVATQRPSVDVVTGVIKANIPSRIAFAVSSAVDSRTILDATGAEKLLGYGDMLYIPMGDPSPTRVQGVYVSDSEVNAITKYASDQARPQFGQAFEMLSLEGEDSEVGAQRALSDQYFNDAIEFVITNQRASTSSIQRQFQVGYNRAANIMDGLEEIGVIGGPKGSRPRDILVQDLEKFYEENPEFRNN